MGGWVGGWPGGWVAGSAGYKAISASTGAGAVAELGNILWPFHCKYDLNGLAS